MSVSIGFANLQFVQNPCRDMLILDRSKNDTSAVLDMMRALAAQMVCIGHALNFGLGSTITFAPNVGVLIFFVLSGFVIAYTLSVKSRSASYSLRAFAIERFSRIYTAFLPAIILIAFIDYLMRWLGHPLPGDAVDLRTLIGNITMRQGLPSSWGVSTFGSAGHLTSVAIEFHIYFFVGAIFFLLIGRAPLLCAVVAVLFSTMPLGYFSNIPGSDHALFVIWLAGFAAYFVASVMRVEQHPGLLLLIVFVGLTWYWAVHRTPNDYDLSNYPTFALAFLALIGASQQTKLVGRRMVHAIRFVADYSFSLFLIHLTIIKAILPLPLPVPLKIAMGIFVANSAAILFSYAFERHYKRVSSIVSGWLAARL